MKLALLSVLIAASACSQATMRRVNQVGAGVMVVSLACDGGGTMRAASTGWRGNEEGGTPARAVMGARPSMEHVGSYFALSTIALLGVAQLLPERARPFLYGAVAIAETHTAIGNVPLAGPCGL